MKIEFPDYSEKFQIMTLRLFFPEWQGGFDSSGRKYVPEFQSNLESLQAYHFGANLINYLAPPSSVPTIEIPIPLTESDEDLAIVNGVAAQKACLRITKSAVQIIKDKNPEKIITLGGECSVSVPPFTFLANKYAGNIAIVWFDAHPDIGMPGDTYPGYHAMALGHCMGMGDPEILKELPGKVPTQNCIIVGLRQMEPEAAKRKVEIGLKSISPEEVRAEPGKILDFLKSTGVQKVLIHFDLDVLDPQDLFIAVGYEPNGIKLQEMIEYINLINQEYDIVALTISEHYPSAAIRIKKMMEKLPLFK